MNWEHFAIKCAIIFVVIFAVHFLYRVITGNSLDDDAQWYQRMKKEERERKKGH